MAPVACLKISALEFLWSLDLGLWSFQRNALVPQARYEYRAAGAKQIPETMETFGENFATLIERRYRSWSRGGDGRSDHLRNR